MRTVEARARESNAEAGATRARARASGAEHPDQQQASRDIAEALGSALGAEVRVKATPQGGYRAELSFSTSEEAIELARRLRPRAVA